MKDSTEFKIQDLTSGLSVVLELERAVVERLVAVWRLRVQREVVEMAGVSHEST